MRLLRRARRWLAGPSLSSGWCGTVTRQTSAWRDGRSIIRTYDGLNLVLSLQALFWLRSAHDSAPMLLWPVRWIEWIGIDRGILAVHALWVVAALLAALRPWTRSLRALAWFGILEVVAIHSSYGKIVHSWHAWMWAGLCLLFLPADAPVLPSSRRVRRQTELNVLWLAQALLLLFYSLTGGWKLLGAVVQAARGEVTVFSPDALAIQIAHASLMEHGNALWGPFFIRHSVLGWPMFLLVLYLEVFAFVVAFRPVLQRAWAVGLIGFHGVVYLTMSLDFSSQALLTAVFFLRSPFAPPRATLRDGLRALPILGIPLRGKRGSDSK